MSATSTGLSTSLVSTMVHTNILPQDLSVLGQQRGGDFRAWPGTFRSSVFLFGQNIMKGLVREIHSVSLVMFLCVQMLSQSMIRSCVWR